MCHCICKSRVWSTGKNTSVHVHAHPHSHTPTTRTHTGPSSDLHWDSRDQPCVATAVSQRVRLPCHHHPQGLHQGNDPTSKPTHTSTLLLPPPPTPVPKASFPSCWYRAQHKAFWVRGRHTSWSSWIIHILKGSSAACGCRTETCSQEMSESAMTALSFNHQQNKNYNQRQAGLHSVILTPTSVHFPSTGHSVSASQYQKRWLWMLLPLFFDQTMSYSSQIFDYLQLDSCLTTFNISGGWFVLLNE